jgi:cephalosporin hydroxylase
MSMNRYREILLDLVALLESFVRQPVECFRLLRALPQMLAGSLRARDWTAADSQKSSPTLTGQSNSEVSPNPFAAYFQSHTEGRGIWKYTHYLDVYQQHLAKFVGKEVHVVEIGIYSGGSLEMWKSCFGPNCKVYGVDIREECKVYAGDGVEIFIGDQEDPEFWEHFKQKVPKVDILIDDGGHLAGQQIVTLEEMLPHLQPGGVFLCEDVITVPNKFPGYIYGLGRHLNAYAYRPDDLEVDASKFQSSIHSIHLYPYLTVIEKSPSPVDHFSLPMQGTEWRPLAVAAAAHRDEIGLR